MKVAELKSTFPGLWKYTGERNGLLLDAYKWLEDKRKDDDIGDLWRVHDKLYNLEPFITKHPGGADWIDLTRGTDITEAFESSHVVNVSYVERILAKHYVRDARTKRISPYTFNKDEFYQTLKRRIEPVLKEVGTGSTDQVKSLQDLLAASFLLLAILGAYLDSVLVLMVAGVVLNICITCAHNFFHMRDTWRRYFFDLGLQSSKEWRVTHGLSHHMYPNTLLDIEISYGEPLLPFLPTKDKTFLQRFGSIFYQHLVYFGGFLTVFAWRTLNILTGKRSFRPEILLAYLELVTMAYVAPSIWSGVKAWALVHSTCSYFFMLVGFAAGHHHPVCFHDGDEARPNPDFGLCQLDATRDKSDNWAENLFVIMATFGNHPLHHLFPGVCHSKLKYIKPIMEETLKDFQLDYERISQWQLLVGLSKQYARNTGNKFNTSG